MRIFLYWSLPYNIEETVSEVNFDFVDTISEIASSIVLQF